MIPGKFIVFEGGEGSGKTTQLKKLRLFLEKEGIPCLATREPGGTPLGESLRSLIVHQSMDPWTEYFLLVAARSEHISQVILPNLRKGVWVLCDRFLGSTLAYQGYGRGLDLQTLRRCHDRGCQGLLPDWTFYLDISPKKSLQRKSPQDKNRFETQETLAFHTKVFKGYRKLYGLPHDPAPFFLNKNSGISCFSSLVSPQKVHGSICKILEKMK